jgi:hypothetical protein
MASATVPGPGAYSPDGKLRTKIPISLQSRHFPKDGAANQPGPGAYTPVNPNFVQTKWTMLGRSKGDKPPATPGPLDYRPEKPQSARASTIHSKIKYKDSMAIHNPGPGAYDETPTSKIRRQAPSYTLLGRTSYEPMSCNTPGPGAYQAPGVRTPIAYSLTPRREIKMSASTPGPGAYSPSGKQGRAAGVGIGDRWNQKESLANPGPGAYTPSVDFYSKKETSPKYSMTARRDSIPSAANPGPGAYTPAIDTIKVRSPRYSLQGKTESLKSPITPGPAHYNPQRPVTSPGISIKSRIDVKPAFVTPSPAHYQVRLVIAARTLSLWGSSPFHQCAHKLINLQMHKNTNKNSLPPSLPPFVSILSVHCNSSYTVATLWTLLFAVTFNSSSHLSIGLLSQWPPSTRLGDVTHTRQTATRLPVPANTKLPSLSEGNPRHPSIWC